MAAPVLTNWFGHIPNPFDLREPPKWFLQELAAFDPHLVIYPSQEDYYYRIARRATRGPGLLKALSWGTDSAVCVDHKLVPVTSFGGNLTFSAHIFQYFADRDTWRHGGAKKSADLLDEQDKAAVAATNKEFDSENTARARSMYRTYKTRVGERISLADTNRGRGPANRKATTQSTRTGTAPVPPTGWNSTPSGIVTPPSLR